LVTLLYLPLLDCSVTFYVRVVKETIALQLFELGKSSVTI